MLGLGRGADPRESLRVPAASCPCPSWASVGTRCGFGPRGSAVAAASLWVAEDGVQVGGWVGLPNRDQNLPHAAPSVSRALPHLPPSERPQPLFWAHQCRREAGSPERARGSPRGPQHAPDHDLRAFWALHAGPGHLPVRCGRRLGRGVAPCGFHALRLLTPSFAS